MDMEKRMRAFHVLKTQDIRQDLWQGVSHKVRSEGVCFNEIFSHAVKHISIRILLAMVTLLDIELEQMDIKIAFLHDNFEKEILMSRPEDFKAKGHKDYGCLLYKFLYGLKQSPKQWHRRFDHFMISNGYYKSKYDSVCLS